MFNYFILFQCLMEHIILQLRVNISGCIYFIVCCGVNSLVVSMVCYNKYCCVTNVCNNIVFL